MDDIVNESKEVDAVEEVVEPVVENPVVSVLVHPLHYRADSRREYTVITNGTEKHMWLLPTKDVPGDFEFAMTDPELDALAKPYGFEKELKQVLPSVEQIQRALWLAGVITLDDLQNTSQVARALNKAFPSAQKFVQFSIGE